MNKLSRRLSIQQVFPICDHSVSLFSLSRLPPPFLKSDLNRALPLGKQLVPGGMEVGGGAWRVTTVSTGSSGRKESRCSQFPCKVHNRGEPRGRE